MSLVGLLGLVSLGSLAFSAAMTASYVALKRRVAALPARHGDIEALSREVEKRKIIEDELRAAKDVAERASQAKTHFLANMSHELRTPLNAIIGFAEVIAGELSGPVGAPVYKEYAGDIAASGRQLFEILSNILDMARIEAGKAGVSESEFPIRQTMQSAIRMCAAEQISGKTVEIICDSPSPRVRADERMIRQALVGLISNALKFSAPGGRVVATARPAADGGLNLCVSDTGAGIPADKLGQVLEPFSQLEDAYARRTGGLGLGLPLAKALAELHGGELVIETAARGTSARIYLPAPRVVATDIVTAAPGLCARRRAAF